MQNLPLALAHVTRTGKVQHRLQQYSRPKLTFLHDLPASLDVTRDQLHLQLPKSGNSEYWTLVQYWLMKRTSHKYSWPDVTRYSAFNLANF